MDYKVWIKQLFQTIDSMNADKFASLFADNGTFKFGNGETVSGKNAIRQYVAAFFSSIKSISHEITDIVMENGSLVCLGEVTYTRHDSSRLTAPFADYIKLDGELAVEYQVYADISALYK